MIDHKLKAVELFLRNLALFWFVLAVVANFWLSKELFYFDALTATLVYISSCSIRVYRTANKKERG